MAQSIHTHQVIFPAKGQMQIEPLTLESPDDSPLAGHEVLIRNEASIISAGTELITMAGRGPKTQFPIKPGYGCIGVIEAIGPVVEDLSVGQRVFYAGRHAGWQRFHHTRDNQWATVYPLADEALDLPAKQAVFCCMAQIAMTAVNVAHVDLAERVAVFGLGLVGNLAAQQFKIAGCEVIGIDPSAGRRAAAERCGLQSVAEPEGEYQTCVDASGLTPVMMTAAARCALFGQLILLGSPRTPHTADVTQLASAIHHHQLTVRSGHMWKYPHLPVRGVKQSSSWAIQTTLKLIARGQLQVEPLLSHLVQPEQVPAAYEGLATNPDHYLGVVIDWAGKG